jgi:hypothetical protein
MAYIVPKVLIQQEFTQVPVYAEFPLAAFIVGPQYSLTRYDVADEKQFTRVVHPTDESLSNNYQPAADVIYEVPNVPAGGKVDHDYTKVYFEDVVAKYFPNEDLGSNSGDAYVSLVENSLGNTYKNRVRFLAGNLTDGNGYSRASYFSNRNVKVGDLVKITDENGTTLETQVKGLLPLTSIEDGSLAATVGSVIKSGSDAVTSSGAKTLTSASGDFTKALEGEFLTLTTMGYTGSFKIVAVINATTLTLDRNVGIDLEGGNYRIGGTYGDTANVPSNSSPSYNTTTNGAFSFSPASTTYVGHPQKRILADTYTVTQTSGSSLSTARFSVASQAGAFATKTNVALVDSVLVIDNENGNDLSIAFGGIDGSQIGNSISVAVTAVTYYPGFGAGGTYRGTTDIVYKLTVERGGPFYNGSNGDVAAKVSVTSSGVDSAAAVLVRDDTSFPVGNYGVTAYFDGGSVSGGLITGDSYYIVAKSAKLGPIGILELADELPASTVAAGGDIAIELFLKQASAEIPALRSLVDGTVNWSQIENYITLNAGATTYVNSLLKDSEPVKLEVSAAKVFVHHRDLLQDNVNSIGGIRSSGEIESKLGTIHPDNPIAQAVYDAVLNSNNAVVYFLGVESNDLTGYNAAIEIAKKSDKVYSFVPLTFDREIQDAVIAHVNAFSTPEVGRWRIAWIAAQDVKTSTIYGQKEDGSDYVGTITDDLQVPGTQYRLLTIPGARFIDDGIRANDAIRFNFRLSADGKVTYDEYFVDEVRTQTTLALTTSLVAPLNSPVKVEVIRHYTRDERANNIAHIGGDYNNRRVRAVFPDSYKANGVTKQGYFLAAGLAGLRSGVVPHQGLTNTQILGVDDLSKVVAEFTQDQLNVMAEQGIWIVTQEVVGATAYVRHQLTTAEASLNTSEDSITTNVDSISYALKNALSPYIGTYNVNRENVIVIRDALIAELYFRATSTGTVRAGNQLTSFTPATDIVRLEQNPTYKDRIDVEVRLNVPYPLNFINLKLVV